MNAAAPQHNLGSGEKISAKSPKRFINREFSWLQFNRRVLEEAVNSHHPLLERVRFLSISANNLNEFMMVRVAGLAGQVREQVATTSDNGETPIEQLTNATREIGKLQQRQLEIWRQLQAELRQEDVHILRGEELSKNEREWAEDHFLSSIFPVLTPLCIDPAHPFPFMPNLGRTLVLHLENYADNKPMTALIRLPHSLPRFVKLDAPGADKQSARFIANEEIISLFIDQIGRASCRERV